MTAINKKHDVDYRADAQTASFDVVLYPYRSMSPKAFAIFMGVLVFLSVAVGLYFTSKGAWPVLGFLGLELVVVYSFFRASFRQGRVRESIYLTAHELRIEEINEKGQKRYWSFAPQWVRTGLDQNESLTNQGAIRIFDRAQGVAIGSFLSPAERAEVKEALDRALMKLRV